MALKQCPDCEVESGPRKQVCECGYVFIPPTKNKQAQKIPHEFLGQGMWVYDQVKGHPKLNIPNDITGILTNKEIAEIVVYEGLGYSVYDYIQENQIKDPKLKKLWQTAKKSLQDIVQHLEEK